MSFYSSNFRSILHCPVHIVAKFIKLGYKTFSYSEVSAFYSSFSFYCYSFSELYFAFPCTNFVTHLFLSKPSRAQSPTVIGWEVYRESGAFFSFRAHFVILLSVFPFFLFFYVRCCQSDSDAFVFISLLIFRLSHYRARLPPTFFLPSFFYRAVSCRAPLFSFTLLFLRYGDLGFN